MNPVLIAGGALSLFVVTLFIDAVIAERQLREVDLRWKAARQARQTGGESE